MFNSKFIPKMAIGLSTMLMAGICAAQQITVNVDGQPTTFRDTQPMMIDNSVYVPMRGVFEQMGATVNWDPSQDVVTGERGRHHIVIHPQKRSAMVDNRAVEMGGRARIIGGSLMVPLRFMSESLGAHVDWDDSTQTVNIRSDDGHFIAKGLKPVRKRAGG